MYYNLIGVQISGRHGPVDRVQRRTVQSQLSAVFRNESSAYNKYNNIICSKNYNNDNFD